MAALTSALVRTTRQPLAPVLSSVCVAKRHESSDVYRNQTGNLTAYRRGRGGRSSFSGQVTTVFGASGFIGRYVVARLGRIGSQIVVPYRADPYHVGHLKLCGDLGQIQFLPYQLRDVESIKKTLKHSNVVINLVGRDWETKNFKYDDVHVRGAARLAKLAKEAGVETFVHVSHLNAQPNPPEILLAGGSQLLRNKYYGEERVREEFPEAIVFRPSDVYGPEDRFLRYYTNSKRRTRGTMPLWRKGEETIKRPVFVADLAEGIINAIQDPSNAGKVFEAVGPDRFYLSEIINYMYRYMKYENFKITHLMPDFKLKARVMESFPVTPPLVLDKLASEHVSDVTHYLPTLEDLDVTLTRFQERAPYELKPFQLYSYYQEAYGEFAQAAPPQPIVD